jgi:two-component system cell cycle sensor histidine kinase/response regulator CckA
LIFFPFSIGTGRIITEENLMTLEEMTKRSSAKLKPREREQRFRAYFEHHPDAVYSLDLIGKFLNVNPACEKIFGYRSEELLRMSHHSLIIPEDKEKTLQYFEKAARGDPQTYEISVIHKNGQQVYLNVTNIPIIVESKIVGIYGIAKEITEHKQAEQEMAELQDQFRQSQKMEAIGRLAGGIAHDFNNMLTVIKGYSQLSLIDLQKNDPLRENVEEIQKATQRASDLTRQLLAFSRRQVLDLKVLDLNTLLRDLDKMLRRVIGEDIELVTVLAGHLGNVKADPGQIEQILLNLAVNARDAMLFGGKLSIVTTNVELGGTYTHSHVDIAPGHYVILSVSDTGVGMTPEVKERIFEPFFTTKEKGKGTGLGLSTVYGIVKQSGGDIWVDSKLGKGTIFKIYLPQVEDPLDREEEATMIEELPCGSETILVVEDEEEVRKLVVKILGRQGFDALEASNAGEALLICEQWREPIHLILIDVVMPQMSGPQLVNRLLKVRQGFEVLYMSGYTDDAIVHHGILKRGVNYIQKPFTADGLVRKVREVLNGSLQISPTPPNL